MEQPPKLSRTRSQVIADDAVAALQQQRDAFLAQGVSTMTFFFGTLNVLLVAFVIGRWPMHYWVFHAAKGLFYYPVIVSRFAERGVHWSLIEVCWVANAVIVALLLLVGANELLDGALLTPAQLRLGFLAVFVMAAGPLGWAVSALGNALLLHSVEHMASLFIHAGPFLTCWSLFDAGPERVAAWYPHIGAMLADLRDTPPASAWELLAPSATAYLSWWVPYTLLHLCALHDGLLYVQSFEASSQKIFGRLACGSRRLVAFCYCVGHLIATTASGAFAVALYASPHIAFTLFCLAMLTVALYNGASRYRYYLIDVYGKKLRKAVEESLEGKDRAQAML